MTTRQDWLLMALAHRRGQSMAPVQIQKTMFLMRKEAGHYVGAGFYNFIPYNYGPFDADIYRDLDALAAGGLVTKGSPAGRAWNAFTATPLGMDEANRARQDVDEVAASYLERVVDWVCSLTFPVLVRAIYEKYPEFRANSVFVG